MQSTYHENNKKALFALGTHVQFDLCQINDFQTGSYWGIPLQNKAGELWHFIIIFSIKPY